ncbi:unnamed protein product, partial [Allacma fusca]
MWKPYLFRILWAQSTLKILLAILLVSTGAVYWMWNRQRLQPLPNLTQGLMEDQQERFWFNLVVTQNISKLTQLPTHVLRSDSCFWLTQLQKIREANTEVKVETLSRIMQSQMERVFEDVECSKRLTLHCGHQGNCGFGCQLHHRAFCVLVAFTLGIPLIHNKSEWPFNNPANFHICVSTPCVPKIFAGEFEKDFAFNANHPVIGIQARRTDKIGENKDSYHKVTEYMHVVKVHFQLLEVHRSPKTVYVASDDHTVLEEIQKMYRRPEWKILGFQSNRTMFYQQERYSGFALKSVLRDIYFLAKSDYVVCGLSSNICRLIME